ADARLNVAFLGVALRVAASKLRAELEAEPAAAAALTGVAPAPTGVAASSSPVPVMSGIAARLPLPPPAPDLVDTGLSWSGSAPSSRSGAAPFTADIGVSDAASSRFLSACTKALGASIGPMARVFVKEAVRRLCGERPFSRADGVAL